MERTADVTVFGATGFTGQHVVAELLRSAPPTLRLAIAGRNGARLRELASKLEGAQRLEVIESVDITNYASVLRMAASTRLLLSCVGPFRLYGEAVVRAAAEAGTDYLDICGEPEFIEHTELRYSAAAARSGAFIASAAGFDSVPADLGALFMQRQFKPPAVPSSVQAVISLRTPAGYSIHYATWEAAVLGMASASSLRKLRTEAKAAGRGPPPPALVGPRPPAASGPTWDPLLSAYTLPFPGADASVVRRTQAALSAAGEPPVHFTARFAVPSAYYAAVAVVVGGLMMSLCRYAWGRALLLRFPGLFSYGLVSHAGPTQDQMRAATAMVALTAQGYSQGAPGARGAKPDKQVRGRVVLGDPGYLFTSVILVQCALALLLGRAALAERLPGGVYTVGALLRDTDVIERLNCHGVRFELVGS